jgi:probable HAF family extracellular repeat protein
VKRVIALLLPLLFAGCADQGPTSPPLAPAQPGFSSAQMDDEETMMSFMGGGIEDVSGGVEPASLTSTQSLDAAGVRSIDVEGAAATRAFGINARGQIVGSYTDATGTHGYLWTNGNVTRIKFPGAISTEAWGINPQGDVVGRYRVAGDARTFGFLLSGGVYSDISVGSHLHTLPIKISPAREIVGCFHDTNFLMDMRGYVQRADRVTSFEMWPSTMHNGVTSGAKVIAGIRFESAALVHGYVLDRGEYTQFDAPGATFTQAWDVNQSGTVVGYFHPVTSRGFSRDADGSLRVIDVPGALFTRIFGINPQGDMVGSYADGSGRVHGFLLRGRDKN